MAPRDPPVLAGPELVPGVDVDDDDVVQSDVVPS